LALAVAMASALASGGCASGPEPVWSAVTSSEAAPGLGLQGDVIPFVAIPWSSEGEARLLHLGYWDLDAGVVSFDPTPLCRATGRDLEFAWDGGARVGVVSTSGTTLTEAHPSLSFVVASPRTGAPAMAWGGKIACPSESGTFIAVSSPANEHSWSLEVQQGDKRTRTYRLTPPDTKTEFHRVIDIIAVGDSVEIVLEALTPNTANLDAVLYVARLEGGRVTWQGPVSDLGVSEVGGGTQMGRLGGKVYIGVPGGEIRVVDLQTGEVTVDGVLTSLIQTFDADHSRPEEEMCLARASVFGYRGTLILEYSPERDRAPAPAYILAVRDGEVVGEIEWVEGRLTVRKDGLTTMDVELLAPRAPSWATFWVFPQG